MRNRTLLAWFAATLLVALSLLPAPATAVDSAAIEDYLEAAIARLEMAAAKLEEEGRVPTAEEEKTLLAEHSMSQRYFYSFAGKHQEAIERYLAEHPEVEAQIESLSARIDALVAQEEDE